MPTLVEKAASMSARVHALRKEFNEDKVHRDHGRFASGDGGAAEPTDKDKAQSSAKAANGAMLAAHAASRAAEAADKADKPAANRAAAKAHEEAASSNKGAAEAARKAGWGPVADMHESLAAQHTDAAAKHYSLSQTGQAARGEFSADKAAKLHNQLGGYDRPGVVVEHDGERYMVARGGAGYLAVRSDAAEDTSRDHQKWSPSSSRTIGEDKESERALTSAILDANGKGYFHDASGKQTMVEPMKPVGSVRDLHAWAKEGGRGAVTGMVVDRKKLAQILANVPKTGEVFVGRDNAGMLHLSGQGWKAGLMGMATENKDRQGFAADKHPDNVRHSVVALAHEEPNTPSYDKGARVAKGDMGSGDLALGGGLKQPTQGSMTLPSLGTTPPLPRGVAPTLSPTGDQLVARGRFQGLVKVAKNDGTFQKLPVAVGASRLNAPAQVATMEGTMTGKPGDWLVTGVAGEKYIVDDSIFRRTFRPLDAGARAAWAEKEFNPEKVERDDHGRFASHGGGTNTADAPKPPAAEGGASKPSGFGARMRGFAAAVAGKVRDVAKSQIEGVKHFLKESKIAASGIKAAMRGEQVSDVQKHAIKAVAKEVAIKVGFAVAASTLPGFAHATHAAAGLAAKIAPHAIHRVAHHVAHHAATEAVERVALRMFGRAASAARAAQAARAARAVGAVAKAAPATTPEQYLSELVADAVAEVIGEMSEADWTAIIDTANAEAEADGEAVAGAPPEVDAAPAGGAQVPMPEATAKAARRGRVAKSLAGDAPPPEESPDEDNARGAATRTFAGIPVVVDRPKGFVQRGTTPEGAPWERVYQLDYGYIADTNGGDGDGVDVFLGPNQAAPNAYWIVQHDPTGGFDEFKVMLGFDTPEAAKAAYLAHVPERFFGSMTASPTMLLRALVNVDPMMVAKSAFASGMRAELRKDLSAAAMPIPIDLRTWEAERGLTSGGLLADDPSAPMMGAAVLRLSEAPVVASTMPGAGGAGMGSRLVRAALQWLLDAWDAAPVLCASDPAALTKSRAFIAKSAASLADAAVAVFNVSAVNARRCPCGCEMPVTSVLPQVLDGARTREQKPPESALAPGDDPANVVTLAKAAGLRAGDLTEQGVRRLLDRLLGADAGPATVRERRVPSSIAVQLAKADQPELRYVLGIVLVPEEPDMQGDVYTADEVRQACWLYMTHFRNVGIQHKAFANGLAHVVECYIAQDDMTVAGSNVRAGTWLLGLHIADDALWEQVKAGKFTGFSIAGFAQRTPVAATA